MRRVILTVTFVLATAAPALAVSLSDLIGLARAGLSDDILIALVESEKSVFRLEPHEIVSLKREGLSDRLILHLLSTPALREEAARQEAFERQLHAERAEPPTFVVLPEREEPAPRPEPEIVIVETVTPVPAYVPVYVTPAAPPKPAKPVYWGWGGKRRPDSWKDRPPR